MVRGCEQEFYAKGYCRSHYQQVWRGQTPHPVSEYAAEVGVCAAPDCNNEFRQRSRGSVRKYCSRLCAGRTHKREMRASGWVPPHRRPDQPLCRVEGCEKPKLVHGYCPMHHERVKKYGDPGQAESKHRPGEWRLNSDGYVIRWFDGHIELQHRAVMADALGRELLPGESPHHKNGDRSDNRIENLELWSSAQPAGQRVADKLIYAREIIARYGDLPAEVIG